MKRASLLLSLVPFVSGCALGSATSAYSVNSKSADSLTSAGSQPIINQAVTQAVAESKAYTDSVCPKK